MNNDDQEDQNQIVTSESEYVVTGTTVEEPDQGTSLPGGQGFFTEDDSDRKKHQRAGQKGGETTSKKYGPAHFQEIGREGGQARAKNQRGLDDQGPSQKMRRRKNKNR